VGVVKEQTLQERIEYELFSKINDSEKIEAFWSVDIQRNGAGDPVPTVTIISDNTGTEEQREAIRKCLWDIADIFREIYRVI
jgi:hypothetical protein